MLWAHFATSFSILRVLRSVSSSNRQERQKRMDCAASPRIPWLHWFHEFFPGFGGKERNDLLRVENFCVFFFLDIGRQEGFWMIFDDFCLVAMVSVVLPWVDSLSVGYMLAFVSFVCQPDHQLKICSRWIFFDFIAFNKNHHGGIHVQSFSPTRKSPGEGRSCDAVEYFCHWSSLSRGHHLRNFQVMQLGCLPSIALKQSAVMSRMSTLGGWGI